MLINPVIYPTGPVPAQGCAGIGFKPVALTIDRHMFFPRWHRFLFGVEQHSEVPMLKYHKARGALSNPDGRFELNTHESVDDGWAVYEEDDKISSISRELLPDKAKTIINYNQSPDIPFDRSINPYRGCEHGCIYCFARPTHSYLGLSAGLDFETRIFYKHNAVEMLEDELDKPGYVCKPITLGINTDAYQPVEKELKITRGLLEVLLRYRHPVTLITKSSLILRDLNLLSSLAVQKLVSVAVSLTSMDNRIKSTLEPRAASPAKRLEVVAALAEAKVPVGVMVAPVIPLINDAEIESLLEQAYQAGARSASYVLLRLPYEVKDLFRQWLQVHYPEKAKHVMNLVRQSRGGKDYDAKWGTRMRGEGHYASMLAQRFRHAAAKAGYDHRNLDGMDTTRFAGGLESGGQMRLQL